MKYLIDALEKSGAKIVFGLEAQGHIPTIEAELKRWNDSNEYGNDMTYSPDVWRIIGKKIGWCPLSSCLSYFRHINTLK